MLAHTLAIGAESVYEMCDLARRGENVEGSRELPPIEDWLRLYRRRAQVVRGSVDAMLGAMPEDVRPVEIVALLDGCGDWEAMSRRKQRLAVVGMTPTEWRDRCREGAELMRRLYAAHLDHVRAEIRGDHDASTGREAALEAVRQPEVRFFCRVWVPCWLEHGKAPGQLLRGARQGNLRAIEDLLRLDKRAFQDSRIRRVYDEAQVRGNASRVRVFHKALEEGPRGSLTQKGVKVLLGALIQKTAAEWDAMLRLFEREFCKAGARVKLASVKLSAPSVQRLFDAVAKDYYGWEADPGLRQMPHGWYMALKRAHSFWPDGLLVSQKWGGVL